MTFDRALPHILKVEGGFVDDPVDHGGRTNKGITQMTYTNWLTKLARPDHDVKLISDEDVADIYRQDYWYAGRCDALPWPLSYVHMDAMVNHRPKVAAKMLQVAAGVEADGIIGPGTLAACNVQDVFILCEKYLNGREGFYRRLVAKEPSQEKFLKNWIDFRLAHVRKVVEASKPGPTG